MIKKEWSKFLKPVTLPRFIRLVNSHWVYLSEITKLLSTNDKILGVGCGTAVDEIYLSHLGYQVKAIDKSGKVLKLAKLNNEFFQGRVKFHLEDMFNLTFKDKEFKVCFSQGVLEHFSAPQIKKAISEQLRVAQYVVFSVPSIHWQGQPFGDENFWPLEKWFEILTGFNLIDYEGYSYKTSLVRLMEKINKKLFKNIFKKFFIKLFATEFCFIIRSKK